MKDEGEIAFILLFIQRKRVDNMIYQLPLMETEDYKNYTYLGENSLTYAELALNCDDEFYVNINYHDIKALIDYSKGTEMWVKQRARNFIVTSWDIKVICNVLTDYTEMLKQHISKMTTHHKFFYEDYMQRLCKTRDFYASHINYDWKCLTLDNFISSEYKTKETLSSCQGDLMKICDALYDYAENIERYCFFFELEPSENHVLTDYVITLNYLFSYICKETNYDREKRLKKCRRKNNNPDRDDDVGSDGISQLAKSRPKMENKEVLIYDEGAEAGQLSLLA